MQVWGHAEDQGQVLESVVVLRCDTDQLFSWEHFQEADEHAAISQVCVQVADSTGHPA